MMAGTHKASPWKASATASRLSHCTANAAQSVNRSATLWSRTWSSEGPWSPHSAIAAVREVASNVRPVSRKSKNSLDDPLADCDPKRESGGREQRALALKAWKDAMYDDLRQHLTLSCYDTMFEIDQKDYLPFKSETDYL